MQTEENRNRMWTFVVLSILGLNICQAPFGIGLSHVPNENSDSAQEATESDKVSRNSTQMYYVKLTVEESAILNITTKLTRFVSDTNLNVDRPKMTTKCRSVPAGTECRCESGFIWSDKVCEKSGEKCCDSRTCIFASKPAHMCVSDKTVHLYGSITLRGETHLDCLEKKHTEKFKLCNDKLLKEMKTEYSTLTGFDILTISKYRLGSVIAYFEMTIAQNVRYQELNDRTISLSKSLSGSLELETSGVINITVPPMSPVCHKDQPDIKCTVQEDLKTQPVWQLNRTGKVFEIFTGTESVVKSTTMETIVTLKNISGLWAGEYTCAYNQKVGSNKITHKASAVIDISFLPSIAITMEPAFPRCQTSSDRLSVRVKCEIGSSNEKYNVTWSKENSRLFLDSEDDYAADAVVYCDDPTITPHLQCTVKNRCNEEKTASVDVHVIYENDQFCAGDGEWTDTKAGFTAVLKCTKDSGQRRRKCSLGGTWEQEVSACVNQGINLALENANIIDIGLGSPNENAAGVFSLLENVTQNTETMNTFANMNGSVEVLTSLSHKINKIDEETTTNDFLETSSNLLERSLNESWTTTDEEGNISLAERYLDAVDQLIQMTNVAHAPKRNIELASFICTQRSQCVNTVFNNTVVLKSADPGIVTSAGFKELENYLPHKDDEYKPNSIIVTTTTKKQLDSLEVQINFTLLKPRPRNVYIRCVSWDNNTRGWSSKGCKWKGATDEGLCVCSHLSTFAILMSKNPVDVPGLNEVTYVGLAVSVVSLIISLAIEITIWSAVVKSNTLYLRHTAHINISLCLLVADCCFLASNSPDDISEMWCKIFVVLKHFCYLSMFFWMLCLSSMLLHQAVFLFHKISKKTYLRLSLVLGYVCPLVVVVSTFLTYKGGAKGEYFSHETCWLLYNGVLQGSIHTFVIPIGIIVIFNVFSMVVVILKLLDANIQKSMEKEKKAAITVLRSVILLTPIFGVTWAFGFVMMIVDLTSGPLAFFVHYVFTLLNAFQGLFILLTTCLGDKLTRDALLNRLKKNATSSTTDSTIKLEMTW